MKAKLLKIVALIMVIGLFSSCSKEYFNTPIYSGDFAVDIMDVYQTSPDLIRVEYVVSNLSDFDYYQGQDGNYYLEFSIVSQSGAPFYTEEPVGDLYSGDSFRGTMFIRVDPRMRYNVNDIAYDLYDADRY